MYITALSLPRAQNMSSDVGRILFGILQRRENFDFDDIDLLHESKDPFRM